ncbi:MAG: hypothetical protein ACYS6W_09275 [Planctomycetota bacterium]|jgi:hypothetical protein
MKLNYLKEKKESVSVALLWFSVVLGVLILVKVAGFFVASANAKSLVEKAFAQKKSDANDMEKYFAKSKAIANELKKKNLFVPPTPKKHPVNQVPGILGSEALINSKWYEEGDKVGDAEVVAIEPTLVRILWGGREKVFAPMQAGSSGSGGPRRGGPEMARRTGGGPGAGAAMTVVGGPRRGPGRFGEEGFRGMREKWENMSEEERQAARERMRERFGGRRGPGGEGGRGGGEMRRGGRGR